MTLKQLGFEPATPIQSPLDRIEKAATITPLVINRRSMRVSRRQREGDVDEAQVVPEVEVGQEDATIPDASDVDGGDGDDWSAMAVPTHSPPSTIEVSSDGMCEVNDYSTLHSQLGESKLVN